MIAVATVVKAGVDYVTGIDTVFSFYMFTLAVIAWAFGRGPGWMAVLLSGFAYSFYFIEPRLHLSFSRRPELNQMLVFMIVGGGITEVLRFAVRTRREARLYSKEAQRLDLMTRALQARMQRALSSIAEPFAILNAVRDDAGYIKDFRVEYMNEAGVRSNRTMDRSITDFSGKLLSEISPAASELGVVDAYRKIVDEGVPYHHELHQELPDATQNRWIEIHACKFDDGLVVQWRDTTERHKSEEQLRKSQGDLLALTESLERRVKERTTEAEVRSQQLRALALDLAETESRERKRLAKLLHDHFQQLISAAKLKAGLVRRGLREEKTIESMRQLESLLEEAIAASRSLATELSPPVLSDGGLLSALEWLSRKMEKDYDLIVQLKTDPNAEPESDQVRTMVFECVRELLFNIVKHAETHQAELSAHLSPEGLLVITIQDHGKGFDLQNALQRSMIAGQDGSFGLFSIRERLSLIGGLLNIRSEPGQGTCVEMSVPIGVRRGAPVVLQPTSVVDAVEALQSNFNGEANPRDFSTPARVVVADDHRLFREGLINLLAQESTFAVVGEASDGEEAVELCRKLKPDVLICDVTMPRLNGVQVTRQVTAELPGLRVVGLSMHEREDMATAMRAAGAVAYVTKSGPSDQLLTVLRSVTSGQPLESI
jgi:signal transduction histidine kinase/ActR/RegA family two-component response regulator